VRETQRAVTPFGGMVVFVEYLRRIDLVGQIRRHMPDPLAVAQSDRSDNNVRRILASCGSGSQAVCTRQLAARRSSVTCILGITHFPTDDTIRNLFRRFGMGEVHQLYARLTEWQLQRLPARSEGYSLDLDSTVFERMVSRKVR